MGGCRCTYRTCRATSDSKTHFFHYPVFDKVRCHQWLSNAQRFDLLDLKLSQLKNRVICQHHFPDDMFMNIKKQKLTHTAVPTLSGPFLESDSPGQKLAKEKLQETPKIDVKNDIKFFTSREKIATFSVPYNEFLKKCDLDQLNDPDLRKSMQAPKKKMTQNRIFFTDGATDSSKASPIEINDDATGSEHPHVLPINKTNKETVTIDPFSKLTSDSTLPVKYPSNNVIILSEKKVTEPVLPSSCRGLKKVSPSFVLKKPRKIITERTSPRSNNVNKPQSVSSLQTPVETMSKESSQVASQEDPKLLPQIVSVNSVPLAANNCPTVLQIEFAPEEAKIPEIEQVPVEIPLPPVLQRRPASPSKDCEAEKKRKYDIRLKNVVEKALSRLDETHRRSELTTNIHSQASSGFKSNHTCGSPKKQSLTAALLRKVRKNSRDIAEIRRLLQQQARGTASNSRSSRSVVERNSAMDMNPESRKKYLFKEISQFLSTKLKSDLYEELFIDNLVQRKSSTRSTRSRN